jgi:hypothetical protein
MKALLLILLLSPLLSFGQWSHETINASFVNHTLTCALVSFSASAVTKSLFPKFEQSWAVGIVAGMAVGLFHEFLETSPDKLDLIADLTGCCIGAVITITIPLGKRR